jgi:hypothetical protein
MNSEPDEPAAAVDETEPATSPAADESEDMDDFFADLMMGRDGVVEGVITHW